MQIVVEGRLPGDKLFDPAFGYSRLEMNGIESAAQVRALAEAIIRLYKLPEELTEEEFNAATKEAETIEPDDALLEAARA